MSQITHVLNKLLSEYILKNHNSLQDNPNYQLSLNNQTQLHKKTKINTTNWKQKWNMFPSK